MLILLRVFIGLKRVRFPFLGVVSGAKHLNGASMTDKKSQLHRKRFDNQIESTVCARFQKAWFSVEEMEGKAGRVQ